MSAIARTDMWSVGGFKNIFIGIKSGTKVTSHISSRASTNMCLWQGGSRCIKLTIFCFSVSIVAGCATPYSALVPPPSEVMTVPSEVMTAPSAFYYLPLSRPTIRLHMKEQTFTPGAFDYAAKNLSSRLSRRSGATKCKDDRPSMERRYSLESVDIDLSVEPDRQALYGLYQAFPAHKLRLSELAQSSSDSTSENKAISTSESEETNSARDIALRLVTEKDPDPAKVSAALSKLKDMSQLRNQILAEQAKQAARSTVPTELLAHLDQEERRLLREFIGVVTVNRFQSRYSPQLITGQQEYILGHFSECIGINDIIGLPIVLKIQLDPGEADRLTQVQNQLAYLSLSRRDNLWLRAKMKHSITVSIGHKEVSTISARLFMPAGTIQVPYHAIAKQYEWAFEVVDALSLTTKLLAK